jgi:thioredoxin 1
MLYVRQKHGPRAVSAPAIRAQTPASRPRHGPESGAPQNDNGKDAPMAGNVVDLTDASFDETVHGADTPVLVDFWAPWCGPCKMLAPIIAELAEEYAGKATICKLNTDDARDTAIEFGINAIPTTILFKDGQVLKKWVGLTSKKDLASAINEAL